MQNAKQTIVNALMQSAVHFASSQRIYEVLNSTIDRYNEYLDAEKIEDTQEARLEWMEYEVGAWDNDDIQELAKLIRNY